MNRSIISLIILLIVNIFPVYGVAYLDWTPATILLMYWAEAVIIALFSIIKLSLVKKDTDAVTSSVAGKLSLRRKFWMFVMIAICFTIVHIALLAYILFKTTDYISLQSALIVSWPFIVLVIVSHGLSFFMNYLGRKEYETADPDAFFNTYGMRIIPMELAIILAYILRAPVIVLIVAKIIIDALTHIGEHRMHVNTSLRSKPITVK